MFTQIAPALALIGLVIFVVIHARANEYTSPNAWKLPALMSAAFLAFSVVAVFKEGPVGFWYNHTQNLWGNQVWFDLLFGFYTTCKPRNKHRMYIFMIYP